MLNIEGFLSTVQVDLYSLSVLQVFFICMLFFLLFLLTFLSKSIASKIIFASLLQTTAFFSFIHGSYTSRWKIAFLENCTKVACNEVIDPLPHVFILTGIVVGLSSLGFGLFIALKINKIFGYCTFSQMESYAIKKEKDGDAL